MEGLERLGEIRHFRIEQDSVDRCRARHILAFARLDLAKGHELRAENQHAVALSLRQRRILQRHDDDGVVVERGELHQAQREIAVVAAGVRIVPMIGEQPGESDAPMGEAVEVSVENGELGQQNQQRTIMAARQQLLAGGESGAEIDGIPGALSIERIKDSSPAS